MPNTGLTKCADCGYIFSGGKECPKCGGELKPFDPDKNEGER